MQPIPSAFKSHFWRQTVFQLVVGACIAFLILTFGAMLIYPGGTQVDTRTQGYSFTVNFFSDLGRTIALNSSPNPVASKMFTVGLGAAGIGLILFFVAFRQFFHRQMWLGSLGTACGIIAGICFIGVALTPANLYGAEHKQFVQWAFRCFLFAALLFSFAILKHKQFPRALAFVFVLFCAILTGYVVLLTRGPAVVIIQAVGQKIIAYASIVSILIQSLAARRLASNPSLSSPSRIS